MGDYATFLLPEKLLLTYCSMIPMYQVLLLPLLSQWRANNLDAVRAGRHINQFRVVAHNSFTLHHTSMNNNLVRPDRGPITPVDEKVAVYQLLLQIKTGYIEEEQAYDLLRMWARYSFSFGRDNTGDIVMIEPEILIAEPDMKLI